MAEDVVGRQRKRWAVFSDTRLWTAVGLALMLVILSLTACGTSPGTDPTVTATLIASTPSATPIPPSPTTPPPATPTPTPTPSPTPEPTLRVNVLFPAEVSPIEPVPIQVTFDPLPLEARLAVSATVLQPDGTQYAVFDLLPGPMATGSEPVRYVSPERLQLPLIPASSTWWLVVHVDAPYPLTGLRVRTFTAAVPAFRDLSAALPEGVVIQIPEAFETVFETGGRQAGGRVWNHARGELGLWWTPGPAEDLTLTTARMLVDATHDTNARIAAPPVVAGAEAVTWQAQSAYRFEERWGGASSLGVVWVIQDDRDWLYLLRLRPVDDGPIPVLVQEVAETLAFRRPGN